MRSIRYRIAKGLTLAAIGAVAKRVQKKRNSKKTSRKKRRSSGRQKPLAK